MITLEQAKNLRVGQVLHSNYATNSDGSCQQWHVNGKAKTWKRRPDLVQVPLKYGLWSYFHLIENQLDDFHLPEDCLRQSGKKEK